MKKVFSILKKIKLKTILLLIVLLAFNSYAWFLYTTKVATGIEVMVTSWNVEFKVGEEVITTNVLFTADRTYPGMEDFIKTITVHNTGGMPAKIEYEIESVTIFGETYSTENNEYTSETLEEMLKNDFPFTVTIETTEEELSAENGQAMFNITLEWPFESGDDERDTYWGKQAYSYYANHPNNPAIRINLELSATQKGA